jgi:hypothetical protein
MEYIKPKYFFKIGSKVIAKSAIKYKELNNPQTPELNIVYKIEALCPCSKNKDFPKCIHNPEIGVEGLANWPFRMSDFEPATKLAGILYKNRSSS